MPAACFSEHAHPNACMRMRLSAMANPSPWRCCTCRAFDAISIKCRFHACLLSCMELQVDMASLTPSDRGYLDPGHSDGAAVAAADYTGSSLDLGNITALATPPGLLQDPTGPAMLQRGASTMNQTTLALDATLSDAKAAVRDLFWYSKQPNVVSKTEEKMGTDQVCIPCMCKLSYLVHVFQRWRGVLARAYTRCFSVSPSCLLHKKIAA